MIRVKSALQAIRFASLSRRLQSYVLFRFGGPILMVVLWAGMSLAQQSVLDVAATKYDIRNGLSDNNVIKGILDKNGGLWVINARGLSFFDGQRFINYTSQGTSFRISSSLIRSIVNIGDKLYAASDSTIDVIDIFSKQVTAHPYVHSGSIIRHLNEAPNGRLLALDDNGNLMDITLGKKLYIGFENVSYHRLPLEDPNKLLLGDPDMNVLVLVDLESFKVERTWRFQRGSGVTSRGLVMSRTYGILNLLSSGMVQFDPSTGNEEPVDINLSNITYFNDQLQGQTLVATSFRNLFIYNTETATSTPIITELNVEFFTQIITDGVRTVFLFSNGGITVIRIPPRFTKRLPTEQLEYTSSMLLYKGILEKPSGELLIFSYQGIIEYDPDTGQIDFLEAQPLNYVNGIIRGEKLFAATDGDGLLQIDLNQPGKIVRHRLSDSVSQERPYFITKLADQRLLVGYAVPLGVWNYDPETTAFEQRPIPFENVDTRFEAINDIERDALGHFWVATNSGLYEVDPAFRPRRSYGTFSDSTAYKLPTNKVNQVLFHNQTLWIATDVGLFKKTVTDQSFSEIAEISGNFVASIEIDAYGRLWIATYMGLVVFDPESRDLVRFYREDGFVDNEYNVASHFKSNRGHLYFGGLNGVVEIDPSTFEFSKSDAKFSASSIRLDRVNDSKLISYADLEQTPITLVGYMDILTIQTTFMEYFHAAYATFEYRLAGIDETWIRFQDGNLTLRNLPVGAYEIEIRGVHPSGQRFDEPLRIPVVVTEPFVRSVYFPVTIVTLVMLLIIAFVYLRYRQKIELRTIRSNLMNDIHDELGGIMTKAALTTELLASKNMDPDGDLKAIQELYREGVQSLRNLLWSISSEDQSTQQFQVRATEWMEFIFRASPIEFMFKNQIPDARFNLSVNQRRQLMPIIKELATNTLKHSNGNQFILILELEGKKYKLVATDNGHHEDTALSDSGYGLKGIRRRVAALGGTCTMEKGIRGFKTEIVF